MLKRQGKQNFQRDNTIAARYVEGLGDIYVDFLYAEFVSVNLLGEVKFQALRKRVGNEFLSAIGQRGLSYVIK